MKKVKKRAISLMELLEISTAKTAAEVSNSQTNHEVDEMIAVIRARKLAYLLRHPDTPAEERVKDNINPKE